MTWIIIGVVSTTMLTIAIISIIRGFKGIRLSKTIDNRIAGLCYRIISFVHLLAGVLTAAGFALVCVRVVQELMEAS